MTLKRLSFALPLLLVGAIATDPCSAQQSEARTTQESSSSQESTVQDSTSKNSNSENWATKQNQSKQAFLGIGVSPLPPVLTSHLPEVIGKERGILISNVSEGSPADKAGLRKHDVLIRYHDQDLYSPEQLVKRVRNDEPGKEIELEYVRGGKLNTVKVTLGEQPVAAPLESNWPGFRRQFDVPLVPEMPDFLSEDQDVLGEGNEWTHFESMTVMKEADGTYRAKVRYRGEKGNSIDREYTGTRREVRDAIESDSELPESQKDQLLRSLDDRGGRVLRDMKFPRLPSWSPWSRELFNWPDLSF